MAVETFDDQDLLSVMPSLDYRKYAPWCSGCYNTFLFLEMAVDSSRLFIIYARQGRLRNTCVGAYTRQSRGLRISCLEVLKAGFGYAVCSSYD